jgi:leucyl-tRNA synthetase
MGWDAFGLPAENYAIKNKIHPRKAVEDNIKRFKEQLSVIGFNHDWNREINTTDPDYYKWSQWIFAKLFEHGLAYQSWEPINWCPNCKTGLSMEDLEGGLCERCGGEVEQKPMRQWVLKMTAYADRLLEDLKLLDWEEQIVEQQRNWIGRSEGARVKFQVEGRSDVIEVFTTRIDTLFGATFMVLAPEHPLVDDITANEQKAEVEKYMEKTKKKTELDRMQEKKKTGAFTGAYAINPINNEKIPVWISDYVLMGYGTGAIMAVPAHDERDFEFATKFKLRINQVIESTENIAEELFTGNGILVNSGEYSRMTSGEAKDAVVAKLAKENKAEKAVSYKMKDWVFSRQRYWGEPIPIIHCEKCGPVAVPEDQLPALL